MMKWIDRFICWLDTLERAVSMISEKIEAFQWKIDNRMYAVHCQKLFVWQSPSGSWSKFKQNCSSQCDLWLNLEQFCEIEYRLYVR